MPKKLRIAGFVVCGLLVLAAVGVWALYQASRTVPEAYREAIRIDPDTLRAGSHEMFNRASALGRDFKEEGEWQASFTAEQINGWLAVDLVEKFPGTLPAKVSDPRVAIAPGRLKLFCRFRQGKLDSVLTLTIEPYLAEANVLALRICSVRAGLVPMPMEQVLAALSKAARNAEFELSWRQADGDPVAMVTLPAPHDGNDSRVQIETLRLRDGEIYLSGRTVRQE